MVDYPLLNTLYGQRVGQSYPHNVSYQTRFHHHVYLRLSAKVLSSDLSFNLEFTPTIKRF